MRRHMSDPNDFVRPPAKLSRPANAMLRIILIGGSAVLAVGVFNCVPRPVSKLCDPAVLGWPVVAIDLYPVVLRHACRRCIDPAVSRGVKEQKWQDGEVGPNFARDEGLPALHRPRGIARRKGAEMAGRRSRPEFCPR
jgi:hypothetical protein